MYLQQGVIRNLLPKERLGVVQWSVAKFFWQIYKNAILR